MKIAKVTDNYIFHCEDSSIANTEIDEIAQIQENCHYHICKTLNIKVDSKIHYYLCESAKHVGIVYGDNDSCNAFNDMKNSIYAVYNDNLKCVGYHEDAHLLSYNAFGIPKYIFIREGLAMFFDRVWLDVSNEVWAKYYFMKYPDLNLKLLIDKDSFHELGYMLTYPICGALTEYIIMVYGIKNYLEVYSALQDGEIEVFDILLGDSLIVIFDEFRRYISSINIGNKTYEELDVIVNKHT
jgi:hypothetical protein